MILGYLIGRMIYSMIVGTVALFVGFFVLAFWTALLLIQAAAWLAVIMGASGLFATLATGASVTTFRAKWSRRRQSLTRR
jgi:hypothetical protein